ncbi:hypothetical protein [Psychromonas sp. SP041]|uniref:hypothetical protein n=1 Tax=Psychromonas sp. SP041 TaxID=1365007 RepID=UPI0010C7AFEF|nr:hypothetical protein [Psychromonas sp. SP041]
MKALKEAFMVELKILVDRIKKDKSALDKIKRIWYFIYRLHSETERYTLYWNGKKFISNTNSLDFYYYNDALDAFKSRLLANTSNYVELVEHKKGDRTNSVIRISV